MKITSIFLWLFFSMLSISLIPAAIANEEVIGRVAEISGTVEIKKAQQAHWTGARVGMDVYFGDSIRTGENGRGLITLVDESIIQIQSDSHMVLNTFLSPAEKKTSVLLFFGKIWNKISKKSLRRKVFEVQTPTAVCGVRGTDFETASYDDGTMSVKVNTGTVEVDNEASRKTLSSNQGIKVGFGQKDIEVEADYQPDWEKDQEAAREKLLSDGEKYGGHVHGEIYKRRDDMKRLVDRAADLLAKKEQLKEAAGDAREKGDQRSFESIMAEIDKISEEQKEVNREIAYYGRRLECHFGLFSRYGDIARHPELSKRFQGKEFILNQLDDIEMIHAEFNAMMEDGMKMSMEDMDDMMNDMRDKMRIFKEQKGKKSIFSEME